MTKGKEYQNWSEKHRVLKFDEIKGQGHAVIELKKFLIIFLMEKKRFYFMVLLVLERQV